MTHIKLVSVRSRDGDELLAPRAKAPDGPTQKQLRAEMVRRMMRYDRQRQAARLAGQPMATRVPSARAADSGFWPSLAMAWVNFWSRP